MVSFSRYHALPQTSGGEMAAVPPREPGNGRMATADAFRALTMIWLFLFIIGMALGAVVAAGVLAPNRTFALRVAGVVLALTAIILVGAHFWKHAVTALAIAAVCSLAVGVMFQKVKPAKAIGGAIAAFILIFVFSWLALQLSAPLLFGNESDLTRWLHGIWHKEMDLGFLPASAWQVLAVLGFGILVASSFLERWPRALAVLVGLCLLALSAPRALEEHGIFMDDVFPVHDPLIRFLLLVLFVFLFIRFVMSMSTDEENPKHRRR